MREMIRRSKPLTFEEAREVWPELRLGVWRKLLVRPYHCGYPNCPRLRAGQGLCEEHEGNPQVHLQEPAVGVLWLRTEEGPRPFRLVQPAKPAPVLRTTTPPGVKEPPAVWHVAAPPFCSRTANKGSIPESILAVLPKSGVPMRLEDLAQLVGRPPAEVRYALVSMRAARKVLVFSSNETRTVVWLVSALGASMSDASRDPDYWSFAEQLPAYLVSHRPALWRKTLEAWARLVAYRLIPGLDSRVGVVVHDPSLVWPCLDWEVPGASELPKWSALIWPWQREVTSPARGFGGWPGASDLKVTTGL